VGLDERIFMRRGRYGDMRECKDHLSIREKMLITVELL
jgi:hypothetical protein